jgi:hypothetical protein
MPALMTSWRDRWPFCTMSAVAVAGWQLLRQARDGGGSEAKTVVARYFAEHLAPEARWAEGSRHGRFRAALCARCERLAG